MKRIWKWVTTTLLCATLLTPAVLLAANDSQGFSLLTSLKALGGNWQFGDTITSSGGGDMFALSDVEAENFVMEVTATFGQKKGAASLMFFATDNPAKGSYIANIDLSAGNARIFRFETGGVTTLGEYKLTYAEKSKTEFLLRVEVSGDSLIYQIDGKTVVSVKDTSKKIGKKLGLLTFDTSVTYTGLRYKEISATEDDPDTLYRETYRPQFHFSPQFNWMNDPNGLVYDPSNGTYHLFFQYNPLGLNIANQVWGHAVSRDLVHWEELDIAIPQDSLGAVFSGSAVVDENNTSGFFTDNKPGESKLVALFTSDGGDTTHGHEKQCIAYSKDHGVTWIRPTMATHGFDNPVISNVGNKYGRDFRDPKVFWHDGQWMMVIAGGRARIFTSPNLKDWTLACDMGMDSECPDLYPLALDGNADTVKWVYTASGKWYIVGRLEKTQNDPTKYQFIAESERITYNGGSEVYATQSFYNDGSSANRRIAISWIQDHSASAVSDKGWNGAMTLPYEQKLITVNGKMVLTSYPVAEVDSLRAKKTVDLDNTTIEALNQALSQNPALAFDGEIVFRAEKGATLTFMLRSGGDTATVITYTESDHMLRVSRAKASAFKGSIPVSEMAMPLYPDKDGNITLRILLDTSILEVFGNKGEAPICGMIFPSDEAINLSASCDGTISLLSASFWQMKSAWHEDETIYPKSGMYFAYISSTIPLEKQATVTVYRLDDEGVRHDDVTLSLDEDKVKIVDSTQNSVTLLGVKKGSVTLKASYQSMSETLVLSVDEYGFITNLKGWTSNGAWYIDKDGYSIAGSSGDTFAFSDTVTKGSFSYEGDAILKTSGCLGLVFGATHPKNPTAGIWYGANIDTYGDHPVMKLFCNQGGREIWNETYVFEEFEDAWYLSLTYNEEEGLLTYRCQDIELYYALDNFRGGTLGIVSWNGGGSFNNLTYQADGAEDTPITTTPPTTTEMPVSDTTPTTDDDTPITDDQPLLTPTTPWVGLLIGGVAALAIGGTVAGILIKKKKK